MQQFRADLHIHSRFSRATSTKLNTALLAAWARIKGLAVIGSGDFTHPQWRKELRENLRYDEQSGLYLLRDPAAAQAILPDMPLATVARVEDATGRPVPEAHFMLQTEISSIYKRGGKVRKVHNLVFLPTLEAADALSERLAQVGNLNADGRPILGLDSRDLLEIVLEIHPLAFLVPAHIWTPWFSLFGSKSGFDDIRDCYGDLTDHVFALETGLSSDPEMNRLWSALDGYRLISNSDAHSGENLAREANLFSGTISYEGMFRALKDPASATDTVFRGTLEFYPEEGKYHLDGHRKCQIVLTPEETNRLEGICPVCGQPLTVGVLHRVVELADRTEPEYPADGTAFSSLVPLPEILGEILGVGSKSRKVRDLYVRALEQFGSELSILEDISEDDLARFLPPLGEAVARMRRGEVIRDGGYDGEYGVVRMFTEQERREISHGASIGPARGKRASVQGLSLLAEDAAADETDGLKKKTVRKKNAPQPEAIDPVSEEDPENPPESLAAQPPGRETDVSGPAAGLNAEQERAVRAGPGPVLVLAGPGTGKTRTLVARVERLLQEGVGARRILAVTFTRRAASEMDERLRAALGDAASLPRTDTLHALALELWHRTHDTPVLLSEESARRVFAEANAEEPAAAIREAWEGISLCRERLEPDAPAHEDMARRYFAQKAAWNLADYTDLLEFWLEQIRAGLYASPWEHVLVDEVQDLSPLQLALVRSLCGPVGAGFFGIGDPNQSIYGFRGAHGRSREFFSEAWPDLDIITLRKNYRSCAGILSASCAALDNEAACGGLQAVRREPATLHLFDAPSMDSEVIWVAERVSALVGLGGHTLLDAGISKAVAGLAGGSFSPGDIAVLVRTHALAGPLRKALSRCGVPVSEPQADAFWQDPRVALIIRAAGRLLGIAMAADEGTEHLPACPDKVFAKGPLGVAAYFSSIPPFDVVFWQSAPFKALVRAFDTHGGWAGLITWINLQSELELVRSRGERVQIISLHAAKGLEFEVVFLPCLEDGLLPFAGPGMLSGKMERHKGADLEEERRLLYVGMTRARTALFLSHAARRTLYGRELRLKPSRFLARLPDGLFTRSTLVAHNMRKEKQLSLL